MKTKWLCIKRLSLWMVGSVTLTSLVAAESEPVGPMDATWGAHEVLKNCAPCHGDRAPPADAKTVGLAAPVPELCTTCHKPYAVLDGWVHGPVATGNCLLCHVAHQGAAPFLLKSAVSELCYQCHDTETVRRIVGHKQQSFSRCLDCHDGHTGQTRMLLKPGYLNSGLGKAYLQTHPDFKPKPKSIQVDTLGSLMGLPGVKIVVRWEDSPLLDHYGLSREKVKRLVEQQIQPCGIPELSQQDEVQLIVSLLLMEVPPTGSSPSIKVLSGRLHVALQQVVKLPSLQSGQRRKCQATTWETGGIVIWPAQRVNEGLQQAVKVLVGRFCRDYTKANPSSP